MQPCRRNSAAVIDWSRHHRICHAAETIGRGGVVAYPTESVWGLGCDPWSRHAVERLLALKQRDPAKGLILIAADMADFEACLNHLDEKQRQILFESWPGPVTWLVPNNGFAPSWVTGEFSTVALRVTDHPLAAGLCRAWGGPLVSTSANPGGSPPAKTSTRVRAYFGRDIDAITPGAVGQHPRPSEIRDLSSGKVLRA